MLAERFLLSWCSEIATSVFINRLWAGAKNSISLLIPCVLLKTFQCRWRLFWMLRALDPESMWAKMVHFVPPLLDSFCQLHSSWGWSLSVSLYLKTFSSNSTSNRWVRSVHAESWVHMTSTDPVTLMLSGRLGREAQASLVLGVHQRLLLNVLLSNQYRPNSSSKRFSISWDCHAEWGKIGRVYLWMELHSFSPRRCFLLRSAGENVVRFRPGWGELGGVFPSALEGLTFQRVLLGPGTQVYTSVPFIWVGERVCIRFHLLGMKAI